MGEAYLLQQQMYEAVLSCLGYLLYRRGQLQLALLLAPCFAAAFSLPKMQSEMERTFASCGLHAISVQRCFYIFLQGSFFLNMRSRDSVRLKMLLLGKARFSSDREQIRKSVQLATHHFTTQARVIKNMITSVASLGTVLVPYLSKDILCPSKRFLFNCAYCGNLFQRWKEQYCCLIYPGKTSGGSGEG